jgi:hypothetical protein
LTYGSARVSHDIDKSQSGWIEQDIKLANETFGEPYWKISGLDIAISGEETESG